MIETLTHTRPAPDTLPHDDPHGRCRPSCCKTPYFCRTAYRCACHQGAAAMADRAPAKVLAALDARDAEHGRICVMTGTQTDRIVPQHRQGGAGGRADKHRLPNLVWLDSIANGLIESSARWQLAAKVWGISISMHADAERIPVFFRNEYRWYLLTGETKLQIAAGDALERMLAFYGPEYLEWKAEIEQTPQAFIAVMRGGR